MGNGGIQGYKPPCQLRCSPTAETFQRILNNDPAITGIHYAFTAGTVDLADIAGKAIGQSIHLRRLHVLVCRQSINDPEILSNFFMRVAENRSIEHLSVSNSMPGVDFNKIFAPFFALNHNLRCIEVSNTHLSMRIPSLVSAVQSSKELRLERINFNHCRIGDEGVADLINAINNTPELSCLLELCMNHNYVGQLGCTAIGKLLKRSECSVRTLELYNNELNDKCINTLVDAFILNNTLECLELRHQKFVTPIGWCVFSAYLSHPTCVLDKVYFRRDHLDDSVLISLGITLAVNKKMKKVSLTNCRPLGAATLVGWRGFSTGLRYPDAELQELTLNQCDINDDGVVALAAALTENKSVKKLNLSDNRSISSSGWVHCLNSLVKSSVLEDIDISSNNIDDTGAMLLARILGNGGTLVSLDLQKCNDITTSGWRAIANTLRYSTIKNLRIGGTGGVTDGQGSREINDFFITFAEALACNTSLTHLVLKFSISKIGLNSLAKALCDRSSIDNTFASNHTIQYFSSGLTVDIGWLGELTRMNMQFNKSDVARKKILMCHFGGVESCIPVFGPMDVRVLPTALAWIGRDRLGYSLMNDCLKSMPWLIESAKPPSKSEGRVQRRPSRNVRQRISHTLR